MKRIDLSMILRQDNAREANPKGADQVIRYVRVKYWQLC